MGRDVRNGWVVLLWVCVGLATSEVALQLRARFRDGATLLAATADGQSVNAIDPVSGLTVYAPNRILTIQRNEVRTNAFGWRSPPIAPAPQPGEIRLAVLGASTVAGATTPRNDQLFSQQLAALLEQRFPGRRVNVINAGIPGYTVVKMRQTLERRLIALRPQLVLLYAGFNDIATFCKAQASHARRPEAGVPYPKMPARLLLPELVRKNTVVVRTTSRITGTSPVKTVAVAPETMAAYRREIEAMVDLSRKAGIDFAIVSSLTAYRDDMPRSLQEDLSRPALYFYGKCLSHDGLKAIVARINAEQAAIAARHGVNYINLADDVPGGRGNFSDSTHFTVAGEKAVAQALARQLAGRLE